MKYTENQIAEKVSALKAVNQVLSDNSVRLGSLSILHLWFIDSVEDRIIDSASKWPSYVMKKSLDEILKLYFEQDIFFTLMYGYEDNSEAIDSWLIKNECMALVDEESEVA